jgi:hypothetical protein
MVVFFNWPADRPNDNTYHDYDDSNVIPNRLDDDPNVFPRPNIVPVIDDKYLIYAKNSITMIYGLFPIGSS